MNSAHNFDARRVLGRLVHDATVEVIPLRGAEQKWGGVPRGSTVAITCSAKLGLDRTLQYAGLAADAGFDVVPHLAARQLRDEAELRAFLGRLEEVGIHRLYVVGGDPDDPAGPYDSAGDVLVAMQGIEHGITRIGVAGYPEGHPKISDDQLRVALLAKQHLADYIVTQMCFDPAALVRWIETTRAAGVTLPVHIGLAAPMSTRKLAELSMRIGVGSSLRFLTKQHGALGNLLRGSAYKPEKLLLADGGALLAPDLGVGGLHLFSFNQIDATTQWQHRVGGGDVAATA